MHYLYQITNQTNGKQYIGATSRPERRWAEHKQPTITRPTLIHSAIQAEGAANFVFELLCCGEREYILALEESLIVKLQTTEPNGYNKAVGLKKTQACRDRTSAALKGKPGRVGWKSPRKGVSFSHTQVTCPHCGKVGGANVMSRWHFDSCVKK